MVFLASTPGHIFTFTSDRTNVIVLAKKQPGAEAMVFLVLKVCLEQSGHGKVLL